MEGEGFRDLVTLSCDDVMKRKEVESRHTLGGELLRSFQLTSLEQRR